MAQRVGRAFGRRPRLSAAAGARAAGAADVCPDGRSAPAEPTTQTRCSSWRSRSPCRRDHGHVQHDARNRPVRSTALLSRQQGWSLYPGICRIRTTRPGSFLRPARIVSSALHGPVLAAATAAGSSRSSSGSAPAGLRVRVGASSVGASGWATTNRGCSVTGGPATNDLPTATGATTDRSSEGFNSPPSAVQTSEICLS